VLYFLALVAAVVAIWNIHFGTPPAGQIAIGTIGVGLAFFFVITLQENPVIQRLGVFGLMALEVLMVGPAVWRGFIGTPLQGLQIATALIGAILFFVNWRMLPR
jgi:hypothetical protein